jgi:hypothetical protein
VELGESVFTFFFFFFYRFRAEFSKKNEASFLRLAKVLPCVSLFHSQKSEKEKNVKRRIYTRLCMRGGECGVANQGTVIRLQ